MDDGMSKVLGEDSDEPWYSFLLTDAAGEVNVCEDSDTGIEIYAKGHVTYKDENGKMQTVHDWCMENEADGDNWDAYSDQIVEYYCDKNGMLGEIAIESPEGYHCKDGYMIPNCIDSDGDDPYEYGETQYYSSTNQDTQVFEDKCFFNASAQDYFINEYYCKNNMPHLKIVPPSGGFACINGMFVRRLCVDGDDGINLMTKSNTSGMFNLKYQTWTDECIDGETLQEYYCINETHIHWEFHECPEGTVCSDGTCIEDIGCVDSDGKDPYTHVNGTVHYLNEDNELTVLQDECISLHELNEAECEGDEGVYAKYWCDDTQVCLNGRCIKKCKDGGQGPNPFYSQVGVESYDFDMQTIVEDHDYCIDGETLAEYYCDPDTNEPVMKEYDCTRFGGVCENNSCTAECGETDKGHDLRTKGTTTGYYADNYFSVGDQMMYELTELTDECIGYKIREYYCDEQTHTIEDSIGFCSAGYYGVEGECVEYKCKDPDGLDPNTKSNTTGKVMDLESMGYNMGSKTDYCHSEDIVVEYGCGSGELTVKQELIECQPGEKCVEGACKQAVNCEDTDPENYKTQKGIVTYKQPGSRKTDLVSDHCDIKKEGQEIDPYKIIQYDCDYEDGGVTQTIETCGENKICHKGRCVQECSEYPDEGVGDNAGVMYTVYDEQLGKTVTSQLSDTCSGETYYGGLLLDAECDPDVGAVYYEINCSIYDSYCSVGKCIERQCFKNNVPDNNPYSKDYRTYMDPSLEKPIKEYDECINEKTVKELLCSSQDEPIYTHYDCPKTHECKNGACTEKNT